MLIEKLATLFIGREADGGVQRVEIDCTTWRRDHPQLTDYRIEVTSPNGIIYFPDVSVEGNILVWNITQADTSAKGRGLYQVVATGADGSRKTSDHPELVVMSIMEGTAQDTPPDPSKPWTDKVYDAAKSVEELAALIARENAGKLLYISEDGKAAVLALGAGLEVRDGALVVTGSVQPEPEPVIITLTDDGSGNITISGGTLEDDGEGNVVLRGAVLSDDGNGNVIIGG